MATKIINEFVERMRDIVMLEPGNTFLLHNVLHMVLPTVSVKTKSEGIKEFNAVVLETGQLVHVEEGLEIEEVDAEIRIR
jgi:hypothetical protein